MYGLLVRPAWTISGKRLLTVSCLGWRATVRAVAFEQIVLTPVQLFRLQPAIGLCRIERLAISAPQANAQVTLSLPLLRTGQHSGEPPVERLQFMLNFVTGVDDLDVDGIFEPNTEAAVRAFQQNENLSVDGIVGRHTWMALLRRWLLFSQPG
jgi:peptidoglycan hydrolase-like protein with peptidoglycan-binding domain